MLIAILAFPGAQMLDIAGPLDVFHEASRHVPPERAYRFALVAAKAGPLTASNGVVLHAQYGLDDLDGGIDTLLVAGSPAIQSLPGEAELVAWLQRQAPRVRRLGSVCSGALLLARTGLMDGKRVTTHWNVSAHLARSFPCLKVQADQIYVRDGALYTSAGVSAGMDLALALVEEDHGREVALRTARELVLFLKRPGGQSQFSTHLAAQSTERDSIRDVQAWVLERLAEPVSIDSMAARAGMSTRNFSRLFKQDTGMTPAEFVESARIDMARRLLEDTANPLKRIAAHSGFGNPNGLRRAFQRRLGITPGDYRQRFRTAS
ncbi:GlxA family transcriptional regulator [Pseudoduganella ginsengisoli]|uniref:Helix-turn-helix domain-containing protein n=1 Tax=Pseudoduganella ginsengisoli TaxID=1462440 RepID=A0A6L6Q2Q0_9BURK|nr:GlxA family transcriptional regulator [Pseudoduganella ginsengisoli]MTW04153.1 helix-turn-helix domain-containing protein [Pseudoduganella ginsengisoli]